MTPVQHGGRGWDSRAPGAWAVRVAATAYPRTLGRDVVCPTDASPLCDAVAVIFDGGFLWLMRDMLRVLQVTLMSDRRHLSGAAVTKPRETPRHREYERAGPSAIRPAPADGDILRCNLYYKLALGTLRVTTQLLLAYLINIISDEVQTITVDSNATRTVNRRPIYRWKITQVGVHDESPYVLPFRFYQTESLQTNIADGVALRLRLREDLSAILDGSVQSGLGHRTATPLANADPVSTVANLTAVIEKATAIDRADNFQISRWPFALKHESTLLRVENDSGEYGEVFCTRNISYGLEIIED
ncbi:hypothetical protein B0H19DRAFT_1253493 [Mycena capillaripes]|nr:hypothetical protein B0H19DRAFT_1253493 [Mycena capillaripes]